MGIVLRTLGILGAVALILRWPSFWLLLLLAVLLAVSLRGAGEWLAEHSFLSVTAAMVVILVAGGAVLGTLGYFWLPVLIDQVVTFEQQVPSSVQEVTRRWPWTASFVHLLPPAEEWGSILRYVPGVLSAALGGLADLALVLALCLYLAFDPKPYVRALERLLGRPELWTECAQVLRRWLWGRLLAMAVIAVCTLGALVGLGVSLPLFLALLAGVLNFIPNLGPLLSLAPALLMAAREGGSTVLWVIGVYALLQLIEGTLLTPLIQRRMLSLPPAAQLAFQVLMGLWVGLTGLLLASPLLAVLFVAARSSDLLSPEAQPEEQPASSRPRAVTGQPSPA